MKNAMNPGSFEAALTTADDVVTRLGTLAVLCGCLLALVFVMF